MLDATKAYDFTIRFGEETDTLDLEGEIIATSDARPNRTDIEAILPRFTGRIEQVPPAFSALKVDGERAYDLARAGKEVELKSREVTVHQLAVRPEPVEGLSFPSAETKDGASTSSARTVEEITLSTTVSKGTYIRSLARDIAHALGTVGHVTMLRRTKAGPFTLKQAISLDFLQDAAKARRLTRTVLPLEAGLDDIPGLPVTPEQAKLLRHGQQLFGIPAVPGFHLAIDGETPVALVEASDNVLRVVRGFNL
jgi:tRNA pseudouridine55 synthase